MLPFAIQFKSGKPVYEQVLLAVKRALTAGQLKPGDRFPSVRVLSQELRINPNTAHKIISTLVEDGLLKVQPGVGTVISQTKPPTAQQKQELLEQEIERLVVDARMVSLSLEDLLPAIQKTWRRLVKE
ncbi:MAG TPA: GntR family transcriptional regulator [Candidatus Binatia bacterium]|jgi:GntR family transcriptional regulator